jgi:hypothetical protein
MKYTVDYLITHRGCPDPFAMHYEIYALTNMSYA